MEEREYLVTVISSPVQKTNAIRELKCEDDLPLLSSNLLPWKQWWVREVLTGQHDTFYSQEQEVGCENLSFPVKFFELLYQTLEVRNQQRLQDRSTSHFL